VIIVVGVNGTGKTTTIGKLAQVFRAQGKTVLLCAADTFRAAAIEQLEIWGQRTGTEVIKTKAGGDPSAVLFDALQSATARKTDYVIVDTAGRLHTKQNLMLELEKMRRTAQRIVPGRAARDFAGDGCHHRSKWIATGAPVHAIVRSHGNCADQARWHGQRRRGGCNLARVGTAGAVCWRRRKDRRSAAVRSQGVCGLAVFREMAAGALGLVLRFVHAALS
jgi:hypothetical protein